MTIAPERIVGGRYCLKRMLGKGNMGEVWLASDIDLKRPVAIKFILPERQDGGPIERFRAEMITLSQLHSPYVARLLHSGEYEGSPYMVMEYVEGKNLAEVLDGGAPLSVEDAVDYLVQTASALQEAHTKQIVHRDLKPANLLLDSRSGQIKVLDFGIAKAAEALRPKMTADRTFMGTLTYSSPEQLRDSANVGPASDIWSLGAILYELLAGRPAFPQESVEAVCDAIMRRAPHPLRELRPEVEPGLESVVMQCLEKEAERRFADAGELVQALAPFGGPESHALAARATRLSAGLSRELEPAVLAATELATEENVTLELAAQGTLALPKQDAATGSDRPSDRPPLGDASALVEKLVRASAQGKSVVFMLGAGFSVPDDPQRLNGVPGAAEIVKRVLTHFEKRNPRQGLLLQQKLRVGGNDYLKAFEFLSEVDLPEVANDIIRRAVLDAFDGDKVPGTAPARYERQHSQWRMPAGVHHLGEIIALGTKSPDSPFGAFARLHLTTNFDPLLSIAVAKHQGHCTALNIVGNGNIPIGNGNTSLLYHLHGRWDSGDTLHTNLNAERPALASSLRNVLEKNVLVVLGYGGWDDVFMRSLRTLLAENSEQLDVIWAFYDNNTESIERTQGHVLGLRQIGSRVVFYRGVDSNDLFLNLVTRLKELDAQRASLVPPPAPARPSPAAPPATPSPVTSSISSLPRPSPRSFRIEVKAFGVSILVASSMAVATLGWNRDWFTTTPTIHAGTPQTEKPVLVCSEHQAIPTSRRVHVAGGWEMTVPQLCSESSPEILAALSNSPALVLFDPPYYRLQSLAGASKKMTLSQVDEATITLRLSGDCTRVAHVVLSSQPGILDAQPTRLPSNGQCEVMVKLHPGSEDPLFTVGFEPSGFQEVPVVADRASVVVALKRKALPPARPVKPTGKHGGVTGSGGAATGKAVTAASGGTAEPAPAPVSPVQPPPCGYCRCVSGCGRPDLQDTVYTGCAKGCQESSGCWQPRCP